jgi:hypothetical protein
MQFGPPVVQCSGKVPFSSEGGVGGWAESAAAKTATTANRFI